MSVYDTWDCYYYVPPLSILASVLDLTGQNGSSIL